MWVWVCDVGSMVTVWIDACLYIVVAGGVGPVQSPPIYAYRHTYTIIVYLHDVMVALGAGYGKGTSLEPGS